MNSKVNLSIEIDNEKLKRIALYLLAFFIPLLLFIVIFIKLRIYPFGENSYLPVDAYGQYVAFLQYFKNLFLGQRSILYSLSKSIGGEMYGLFAYYLISPYNFVTLLFQKGNMTLAYDIILILKISTCSLTMVYYLNRRKKSDFANLIFGIMYAFSVYVITYGLNIMWLDGVALLPLIISGIDDLIKYKKITLYVVTLTLSIITNYYIGFMICIFAAIYFIYEFLIYNSNNKIKSLLIFILSSISSALIAGIILIPVFIGLKNGRADFSFSNINFDTNFHILNLIAKFYTNSFALGEIQNNSMPPLFCGVLANVLVLLYFLNYKIKLKEKVISLVIIAIFVISFYIKGANLLWTMGNITAWYKYRYAFLFSFFYIKLAKRSYDKSLNGIKVWHIITMAFLYDIFSVYISTKNIDLLNETYIKLDIFLVFIFSTLLLLRKINLKLFNKKFIKQHFIEMIIFLMFSINLINVAHNTVYSMKIIRSEASRVEQSTYATLVNTFNRIIKNLKEYDSNLYRIEKPYKVSTNDALALEYNGVTYSSSTYSKSLHTFLKKLGMRQSHVSLIYNHNCTKFFDMLLRNKIFSSTT